jgi:hypothetical protein
MSRGNAHGAFAQLFSGLLAHLPVFSETATSL